MSNSTTVYRGKDGRQWIDVDNTNKTLTLADNGLVQNVILDAITITLPATTAGAYFIVRNGGAAPTGAPAGAISDASVLVTIAPNAVDQIAGNGFVATDNKAALNTKATAQVGDEMQLVGDGTNGWNVSTVRGTWARQA